jgi:hypothetical protein
LQDPPDISRIIKQEEWVRWRFKIQEEIHNIIRKFEGVLGRVVLGLFAPVERSF